MVGHLLEYHPGVRKLKEIADAGELGDIHYIYSNRLNLGQLRADENALWSLGAHDISVILHLAGEDPYEMSAHGESYMRPGIEDVVFAFLRFPSGLAAHLHLSWLDPHKERRFTVVGSQRMATFDDMDLERKVTVYDKGFDQSASSYGEYITRAGDIYSPRISNAEPLRLEVEHFVHCVRTGETPRSDGESGLRVVRVLERLQEELERSRAPSVEPREHGAHGGGDLGGLLGAQHRAHRDREVRARELVGDRQLDARGDLEHRRLAVDRQAVVGLAADAALGRVPAASSSARSERTTYRCQAGSQPPSAAGSETSSPRPASS